MSNVRRVPDKEGLSSHGRKVDSAVIVHNHFRPLGHSRNGEIRTGENCRERIKFDSDQRSRWDAPPGRYEISSGTCARVKRFAGEAESTAHWTIASMIMGGVKVAPLVRRSAGDRSLQNASPNGSSPDAIRSRTSEMMALRTAPHLWQVFLPLATILRLRVRQAQPQPQRRSFRMKAGHLPAAIGPSLSANARCRVLMF